MSIRTLDRISLVNTNHETSNFFLTRIAWVHVDRLLQQLRRTAFVVDEVDSLGVAQQRQGEPYRDDNDRARSTRKIHLLFAFLCGADRESAELL
jgi:hypothetical protein